MDAKVIIPFGWLSKDGKLILAARTIRTFAYGFLSVVLAIYLKLIGFDDLYIGLILTTTLVNSVIFTLIASFYADRTGRRKMLIVYAALMSLSGAIFLVTTNYLALIASAFIGTINVTGTETGAFLSIEQAILPQTTNDNKKRNTLYAIYNMVGTFAMSAGILLSGLPQIFVQQYGLNQIESIKPLFLLYSITGLGVLGIYFLISNKVEIDGSNNNATTNLSKPLKQTLSPKSKEIVGKLSGLFAIDSFAGGFVIQSIVSLWFYTKFGVELTTLSYIFSIAGVLTAFSFLVAAKIADRIGLINTMVFTHIPSNILLILVGFAPTLPLAIVLYLARMALSQMDVPTRQSYIVAVVREDERTAAAGITNISRNVAQAVSPSLAGYILQSLSFLSAPFVLGGVLKIVYDIALYFNFKNKRLSDEKQRDYCGNRGNEEKCSMPVSELVEGYRNGESHRQLANRFGITKSTVSKRLQRLGIEKHDHVRRKLSKEDFYNTIVLRYQNGESIASLAQCNTICRNNDACWQYSSTTKTSVINHCSW